MKNNLKILLISVLSIAFGAFSAACAVDASQSAFHFGITTMGASLVLSTVFKLDFTTNLALCTPLIGLKRKCNTPTMGGVKRLYIALTEDILNEFLTFNLALTVGEFAGAIPLVTGKKFVEIEAWYDSTKADGEMKAGGGFTQGMEFKVLGLDKDVTKLMALLYETPVNVIMQGNDDKLYYLGQKYVPLIFDAKSVIPEKGTARKEVTFMAKQDGLTVPIFPLASTVTFAVEPLV